MFKVCFYGFPAAGLLPALRAFGQEVLTLCVLELPMLSSSATLPLTSPLALERSFRRAEPTVTAALGEEVELRLSDVPLHVQARVLSVSGLRPFRRRLMELGLVPGTEVRVVNVAPLGDPLELEVRHCRISIRKEESRMLSCAVSRAVLSQAFAV